MKTKAIFVILIMTTIFSCSKQESVTDPSIDIVFGSLNVLFINQDTIYANNVGSSISVHIFEHSVPVSKIGNASATDLQFAFKARSSSDSDYFIKGKNILSRGGSMGYPGLHKVIDISHDFALPVKFSDVITNNNDTIELKRNDYLSITYKSYYTTKVFEKTLVIIP
jgi:hypothetical protein